MKKMFFLSLMTLMVASVTGCGNLSNDDLIFLAAVPRAEEIAMVVEPVTVNPNALTIGEPAEHYLRAVEIAGNFNTQVDEMLQAVDNLGFGHLPTIREEDLRVWGPHRNVDGGGYTLLLEIRRTPSDDGPPRYSFCLLIGEDANYTGAEITCDNPEDSGLTNVFSGDYTPGETNQSARSGTGSLALDLAGLVWNPEAQSKGGIYEVAYDFHEGGLAKTVNVNWSGGETVVDEQTISNVEYEYTLAMNGRVDFFFGVLIDIIPVTDVPERVSIAAFWDDQAGRADVMIEGGDLHDDTPASAIECWDDARLRTYYSLDVPQYPWESYVEGDLSLCPEL